MQKNGPGFLRGRHTKEAQSVPPDELPHKNVPDKIYHGRRILSRNKPSYVAILSFKKYHGIFTAKSKKSNKFWLSGPFFDFLLRLQTFGLTNLRFGSIRPCGSFTA
jgi:hypothetical protein